jgi:hypothetical protein
LKQIKRNDLDRAYDVNNALSQEMKQKAGEYHANPMGDLGIDVEDLAEFATEYARVSEEDVKKDVVFGTSLTFSMGAITALRARKLVDS